MMLWIRVAIFTLLVPGFVAGWMPWWLLHSGREVRSFDPGVWRWAGLALAVAGVAGYVLCALDFLLRGGGTPAIFFARHLRFLLGEEPQTVVQQGLYRHSRNPMYLSVICATLGQGVFFGSGSVLLYGLAAFVFFHFVVVLAEEPHLRRKNGDSYREYCRRTSRWLPLK